jgi:uncharacterized membrane protein
MTLTIQHLYYLVGFVLAVTAVMTLRDASNPRRWSSGLFWALYAAVFLVGNELPPVYVGVIAVAMALIAGFGGVGSGRHAPRSDAEYLASAKRLGNKLFAPALAIPLITMVGTLSASHLVIGGTPLLDPKATTLVSPGVGKAVAHVTTTYINMDIRFVAVAVYVVGMALFTVVMGNGFAAFPVMTGGVGVPILIGVYHGDPAVMAAIGMLSGYCGTLLTPMAANFNLVPAALLEIDKNAVIRAQVPTALALLTANVFLAYFLMFR